MYILLYEGKYINLQIGNSEEEYLDKLMNKPFIRMYKGR